MLKSVINFVLILAFAVLGIMGVNLIKNSQRGLTPVDRTKVTVKAETYKIGVLSLERNSSSKGVTEAWKSASISAEITGKALFVNPNAEIGERIEKDELLVKLDTTLLELQKENLLASLDSTRISVKTAQQDIDRLTNTLKFAEESLAAVEKIYDRTKKLCEEKSLPENQLDVAKLDLIGARNAVSSARDALALARTVLEQAKSGIVQIEVQIKTVEENIGKAEIKSPISGVVSARNCEESENITAYSPLFVIEDIDRMFFNALVSGSDFLLMKKGDKAAITIFDRQGSPIEGTITRLGVNAKMSTRSYNVKIEFDNRELNLRPGLFGLAKVALPEVVFQACVPIRSVLNDGGMPYVYKLVDGIAELAYLKTGREFSGYAEVLEGLAAGDTIAVSSFDNISPGVEVISRKGETVHMDGEQQ